jgi:two-component system sensor kinase FixL
MSAASKRPKSSPNEQEKLFHLLVDGVKGYAIFLVDLDGRVMSWNTSAKEMKGYGEEEILGQPMDRFYLSEEVKAGIPAALLKKAQAEERVEAEGWRVRKDGSRFWAGVVITALKNEQGELRGYAKVTRDLTEERLAEDNLHASEERFRAVADTANEAIVSADRSGQIRYVNKGFERIFGYAAAEMVGQPLTLIMPRQFHDSHRAGMKRYLAGGEAHVIGKTVELAGLRKDGTEFPIELSLATWKSRGEAFFTGIIRDITDRKRAEKALREAHEELERRVAERTRELRALNSTLQEKLIELETFHDVAIGREHKMMALEEEIRRLTNELAALRQRNPAS